MTFKHSRLLIAGCNKTNCDILSDHLEQLGYEAVIGGSGQQIAKLLALDEVKSPRQQAFHLIFLDIDSLPPDDSQQLLKHLKSHPAFHHIPIVILSTQGNMEGITRYINMGADDYLIQILNATLLQTRVNACLEKAYLSTQTQEQMQKIEWLTEDLRRMVDISISLSANNSLDLMLERILREARLLSNADMGLIYIRTEKKSLEAAVFHCDSLNITMGQETNLREIFSQLPLYEEKEDNSNHTHVACHVAQHGRAVNITNLYNAQEFHFSDIKNFDAQHHCRSVSNLTIPLKNNINEVMAVLQLFNAQDSVTGEIGPFNAYQQLRVEALTSLAAVILNNQLLLQQQQVLLQCTYDMEIGRQVQGGFLPTKEELPQPDNWEIATRFHPAREVAGDFYDAFSLAHDKVGLVIADVCDKGVGAALFMALSRSLLRAFAEQPHRTLSPSQLSFFLPDSPTSLLKETDEQPIFPVTGTEALLSVTLTNNYILNNHSATNMFATLFFGVLDPITGTLTYINGGHNPPVIVDATGMVKSRLIPTGPAIGILPDIIFDTHQVTLEPGDLLLAFTDGVLDARDPTGRFFTESYLLSLLSQPVSSVSTLLERIEDSLWTHINGADQFDDITILAVRRAPETGSKFG